MMSNPFDKIDFDRWPTVWVAISVVVLLACIAVKDRTGSIIAVGSLIFGMGELRNHPMRQRLIPGGIITSRRRLNSPFGLLLDAIGILLIAYGIYKANFVH
ncbi:MAG: hypothetical protein DI547_04825 [Sphingobium sp.]|nr:MAG: hypothetical protein DI547_04825 [Sphingobium sp.]